MLPSHKKFKSAIALNEEYAEYVHTERKRQQEELEAEIEAAEHDGTWQPPKLYSQEDYTPTLAALHVLDEHLQALLKYFVMANSKAGQGPDVVRHPRPYTMVDLMELNDERTEMQGLSRQLGLAGRNGKRPAE